MADKTPTIEELRKQGYDITKSNGKTIAKSKPESYTKLRVRKDVEMGAYSKQVYTFQDGRLTQKKVSTTLGMSGGARDVVPEAITRYTQTGRTEETYKAGKLFRTAQFKQEGYVGGTTFRKEKAAKGKKTDLSQAEIDARRKYEYTRQGRKVPPTQRDITKAGSLTHAAQLKEYGQVLAQTEKPLTKTQMKRASVFTEAAQIKEYGRVIYQRQPGISFRAGAYTKLGPGVEQKLKEMAVTQPKVKYEVRDTIKLEEPKSTKLLFADRIVEKIGAEKRLTQFEGLFKSKEEKAFEKELKEYENIVKTYPIVKGVHIVPEAEFGSVQKEFKDVERAQKRLEDKKPWYKKTKLYGYIEARKEKPLIKETIGGAKLLKYTVETPFKAGSTAYKEYLDPFVEKFKTKVKGKSEELYKEPGIAKKAQAIGLGTIGFGTEVVQYAGKEPLKTAAFLTVFGKIGKIGRFSVLTTETAYSAYKAPKGEKIKTGLEHGLLYAGTAMAVKGLQKAKQKASGLEYNIKTKTYKAPKLEIKQTKPTSKEVMRDEGLVIKRYPKQLLVKSKGGEAAIAIGTGKIKYAGETSGIFQTIIQRKARGTIRTKTQDIVFKKTTEGIQLKYFERRTGKLMKESTIKPSEEMMKLKPIRDEPIVIKTKKIKKPKEIEEIIVTQKPSKFTYIKQKQRTGIDIGAAEKIRTIDIKTQKTGREIEFKGLRDVSKSIKVKGETLLKQKDIASPKVTVIKKGKGPVTAKFKEAQIEYALQPKYKPHISKYTTEGIKDIVTVKKHIRQPTLRTERIIKSGGEVDYSYKLSRVKPVKFVYKKVKTIPSTLKTMGKRGELRTPTLEKGKSMIQAETPQVKPTEPQVKGMLSGQDIKTIMAASRKTSSVKYATFPKSESVRGEIIKPVTKIENILKSKPEVISVTKPSVITKMETPTKTKPLTKTELDTKALSKSLTQTQTRTVTKTLTKAKTKTPTKIRYARIPSVPQQLKMPEMPPPPGIGIFQDQFKQKKLLKFPKISTFKTPKAAYAPTLVGLEFMKPIEATGELAIGPKSPFAPRPLAIKKRKKKKSRR